MIEIRNIKVEDGGLISGLIGSGSLQRETQQWYSTRNIDTSSSHKMVPKAAI